MGQPWHSADQRLSPAEQKPEALLPPARRESDWQGKCRGGSYSPFVIGHSEFAQTMLQPGKGPQHQSPVPATRKREPRTGRRWREKGARARILSRSHCCGNPFPFPRKTIRAPTKVCKRIGGFDSRHLHIQSFTQTGKKQPVFFGAPVPLHVVFLDIIYGTDRWRVPNDGVKVIQWT